ncbi:hypothetical protein [Parasitella parasitica]|uniref:DNA-directed primase/polymerase protein n=1 Tax=Parasitella parasitica TaxID=35722 RepID=A0A0B7NBG2_9FUNG|nr:hypothetical protein [Parasitella parasitica]
MQMYSKLVLYQKPTCYEVILEGSPVFLYLDIDISLQASDADFTFEEVNCLVNYIKSRLITHLDLSFSDISHDDLKILHACTSKKLSLHVIHRGVVFDNHSSSCASYVAELIYYFKNDILNGESRQFDDTDRAPTFEFIAKTRLRSHTDFIDHSVYKKSQQFRCLGSSKIGKNRPLVLYNGMLDTWTDRVDGWFTASNFSMRDWTSTLVVVKEPETIPFIVMPSPHISFASVLMARRRLYSPSSTDDDMLSTGRFVSSSTAPVSSSTAPASSSTASTSSPELSYENTVFQRVINTSMLPFSQGNHSITDDACLFVDEFNRVRSMMNLQLDERLFCLMCETNTRLYKGVGTCSAKSYLTKSGEKAVFCFNCSAIVFVLECGDQYGFHPLDDELIRTENTKLNYDGADDINISTCKKVLFLDAPMGTGKTFLAKNYIAILDASVTVLSITFRVSLAKYLSNEFGMACYLEEGVWLDENTQRRERLVVCLDSILKLKEDEAYDVIIIDEATFVQYHLVAGTIPANEITIVLQKLKLLLQGANKIVFMQHRIPDTSINFYCNLIQCDPNDRNIVTKQKFDAPTVLQPLKKWSKIGDMVSYVIKDYIDNFNLDDQKSNSPFIVFCSRVDFSLALLQMFRKVAEERFGVAATDRIKGVWAQVQNDPWCSRFLTNPNSAAMDCDVLIVTNVLQAGHSLDTHFVTSYDILFNNILSFREELQFTSRLRYLGRTDVRATKHAWIETGRSNQHIANSNKLKRSLSSLVSDHQHVDYNMILSTLASVNSERADSSNRHTFLWDEEYKRSSVTSSFDSLTIDDDYMYAPKWVNQQIKHYIRGSGASSIKNIMQLMNNEQLDDLNGILDEMQYSNVAELMLLHVTSNTTTLNERINCQDHAEGFNVITNIINYNRPSALITVSSIMSSLVPFYNFICFMDYRLYLLNGDDPIKNSWWEHRLVINNSPKVNTAIKLELSGFLNTMGTMLGVCTAEFAITDNRITQVAPTAIFESIEQNGYDKHYTNIFSENNNYNADKTNYINGKGAFTVNRFWSKCLKRFGLKLETKNAHNQPFINNLVDALCICKALVTPDHFIQITSIMDPVITTEVNNNWDTNKVIIHDQ